MVDNVGKTSLVIPPHSIYYNGCYMVDIYTTRVLQVGSSKGIVLPAVMLKAVRWQRGDLLIITPGYNDTIVLRRMSDKEVQALKEATVQIVY